MHILYQTIIYTYKKTMFYRYPLHIYIITEITYVYQHFYY